MWQQAKKKKKKESKELKLKIKNQKNQNTLTIFFSIYLHLCPICFYIGCEEAALLSKVGTWNALYKQDIHSKL